MINFKLLNVPLNWSWIFNILRTNSFSFFQYPSGSLIYFLQYHWLTKKLIYVNITLLLKIIFFLWYNVLKKTSEIYQNFTILHENDCTFTDVLNPNNLKTVKQKPCNRTMTELILKKVTIQEWNNLIEISSTEQKQNVIIKVLGIKHVSLKCVFESCKTGALKSLVYFQKTHTVWRHFLKKRFRHARKRSIRHAFLRIFWKFLGTYSAHHICLIAKKVV